MNSFVRFYNVFAEYFKDLYKDYELEESTTLVRIMSIIWNELLTAEEKERLKNFY